MKSRRNKPPKGVIIAFGAIIAMVIIYLILWAAFPEIFKSLNEGANLK